MLCHLKTSACATCSSLKEVTHCFCCPSADSVSNLLWLGTTYRKRKIVCMSLFTCCPVILGITDMEEWLNRSNKQILMCILQRSAVDCRAFLVLTLWKEGWLAFFMCRADAVVQSNGIICKRCIPCLGVRSATVCMWAPQFTGNKSAQPVSLKEH